MFNSQFKWQLLNNYEVNQEEELFDILFKNRQINDIDRSKFLSDEIYLYDPFLFTDMEKVVKRINEAIEKQEKIMLYGDLM